MPQMKRQNVRVRVLCALAGAWGVATGYAIFILISQRVQEAPGFSAAMHFVGVLTVAVAVVAITEWFRDTIRGEKPETFRSLSAILTSVLLLAVFEVCVLAYEEVSEATFESPYTLQEIAARVSGKEIPYQFFQLSDVPEPRRLLERLQMGYRDLQANRPSPEAPVVYELGPEMAWTLFQDDAPKPSRNDALVAIVKAADPDLSDCARYKRYQRYRAFDPYSWSSEKNPCPDDFGQPQKTAASPQLAPADQSNYDHLLEKLDVLTGQDDAEMGYFTYFASPSDVVEGFAPHAEPVAPSHWHKMDRIDADADIPPVKQDPSPCLADDPNCPLSRMRDVGVLANMTARDLSDRRLRELLTIELNHELLLPSLYNKDGFQFVDVPEALRQSLRQNDEDTHSYDNFQNRLAKLRAQPESEAIDDQIAEIQEELARLESRLLPLRRVVQLNRRLLVAAFPGLLMPATERLDENSANLIVLGLLWMCAGGTLGWILARGVFEERKPGTHASRLGALRGLAAAFGAAPVLVVAYVLLLRLGLLIHDILRFPRELHYLWDSTGPVPGDIYESTLIPATIRLGGYWLHKWMTLAVIVSIMAILCAFWQIYGWRRGMVAARRWRWFGVSAALALVFGLVFDANIPFIYLLVGLVWVTPAVFLGICGPYLRTGSPVPRAWGLISMLMGIGLMVLTILRLWWSAIPLWLCAPGAVLIAVGLVMRAGRRLEEYWPLGALALALTVCGMSALVQRATFLGVLSDVHDLNAYGGYDVKLWPKMPHIRAAKSPDSTATTGDSFEWSDDDAERTRQKDLSDVLEVRISNLRLEALGFGATGDYRMDDWLMSYENNDQNRLARARDDVARRLELSIVGSLGFWLSVGLLAGWAMRTHAGSEGATESKQAGFRPSAP